MNKMKSGYFVKWVLLAGMLIACFDIHAQGDTVKNENKKEKKEKPKGIINQKNYIIYSTAREKKIPLKRIVEDFADYDVIFYGEEHNDSVTHYLENLLFRRLYKQYGNKMALSLEMFDRDVQFILDEYLNGWIKEHYFNKDSRQWPNYKDYKPMVELAKEKRLAVIAANAPFRYVSIASKETQTGLEKLSDQAKRSFAPLPYMPAAGEYKEQLMIYMGMKPDPEKASDSTDEDTTQEKHTYAPNMSLDGQSLWDATMAYSISEYLKAHPGQKVMHVNGRFHTDHYYGIVQQLQRYAPDVKVLVISASKDDDFPKIDFEKEKSRGDYIISTDPDVPGTF